MSLEFIKQINEYVIESLLEANDDDILSMIGSPNYPTREDITAASQLIHQAIQDDKHRRLEQKKIEFTAYKSSQENAFSALLGRPVASMISDIVAVMQNTDNVPEGTLIAFREQQDSASDEDIALIWQSLVELGLIDPHDKDLK